MAKMVLSMATNTYHERVEAFVADANNIINEAEKITVAMVNGLILGEPQEMQNDRIRKLRKVFKEYRSISGTPSQFD
jgi:hypothetical protein